MIPSVKNLMLTSVLEATVLLIDGISKPETFIPTMLKGIHASSNSSMARGIASTLMDMRAPETFSGIYSNAVKGTAWLSVSAYSTVVSDNEFSVRDLLTGDTTIFLQVPLQTLLTTPALGRVLVGALLNVVYLADGDITGRVLFLLDEAARLGRMKVLEVARDVGRKYGITLQLLYQSVGQLEEQWGREGKRAWYDGVSWRAYAAVQDFDTARELSDACGSRGVLAYSEGENTGKQIRMGFTAGGKSKGRNTNVHEIRRPLIKPEELTQDTRADELFVIARGCKPIRCGRAIYFRRSEMAGKIGASRFSSAA